MTIKCLDEEQNIQSSRCFVYTMLHVLMSCRQNIQIIDFFSFSSRCSGILYTYLMSSLLFIETGREHKHKRWLQMAQKMYWALDHRWTFPCIEIIHFLNTYGIRLAFLYFICMKHYIEKGGWVCLKYWSQIIENEEEQKGKVWFDETNPSMSRVWKTQMIIYKSHSEPFSLFLPSNTAKLDTGFLGLSVMGGGQSDLIFDNEVIMGNVLRDFWEIQLASWWKRMATRKSLLIPLLRYSSFVGYDYNAGAAAATLLP